jgi:hypothetical protein
VFRTAQADVFAHFPGGQAAAAAAACSGPTLHSLRCIEKGHRKGGVAGCVVCDSVQRSVQRQSLADIFASLHRKHSLERVCWPNADATKWGTSECYIEMAKLYTTTLGDHTHAITKIDFSLLDGTALFNMIRWCEACDDSLQSPITAAATACNRWGHEGAAQLSLSQED